MDISKKVRERPCKMNCGMANWSQRMDGLSVQIATVCGSCGCLPKDG